MRIVVILIAILNLVFPRLASSQVSEPQGLAGTDYAAAGSFLTTNLNRENFFKRLPGISPDYKLGAGDVIKIDVVGSEMLDQTLEISNSGSINFLPLGTVTVADLTAEELERDISDRIKAARLIKDPEVLVYIESYRSKPVQIVGEVDNPGQYLMSQQLTVMDLILLAGGLDFSTSRYGYLHRRIPEKLDSIASNTEKQIEEAMPVFNVLMNNPDYKERLLAHPEIGEPGVEVIRFDLEPVLNGGVIEPNILLEPDDIFVVPRRNSQFYYVVGDVIRPGVFEIPPYSTLLASQAISHGGGPSNTAKLSKGILVRYDKNDKRQEIKVDYLAILKGNQEDFEIFPDDVIFIPGSNIKTLGYAILGQIPGRIQGTIPINH